MLMSTSASYTSIQVEDSTVYSRPHLGVQLSMKQHIDKVAATRYYHLCGLHQVCCRVGKELTTHLVITVIVSRLDYCNSILPACQTTIAPLQWVQNVAAQGP